MQNKMLQNDLKRNKLVTLTLVLFIACASLLASLAAALAVNNAGVGVAAGVSGISPLWASVCNFVVTIVFLLLGRWLGRGVLGRFLGRFALPLSGALLVALGVCEVFL